MISTGRRFPHLPDEEASNVRTYFVGKNSILLHKTGTRTKDLIKLQTVSFSVFFTFT